MQNRIKNQILLGLIITALIAITSQCFSQTKHTDKFTGDVIYSTYDPGVVSVIPDLEFRKVVSAKPDTTYYLIVTSVGQKNVAGTGCTLLLANGSKIIRPDAEVSMEYASSGGGLIFYRYRSAFPISRNDVELLQKNSVTAFRQGLNDIDIKEKKQTKYKSQFVALLKYW